MWVGGWAGDVEMAVRSEWRFRASFRGWVVTVTKKSWGFKLVFPEPIKAEPEEKEEKKIGVLWCQLGGYHGWRQRRGCLLTSPRGGLQL